MSGLGDQQHSRTKKAVPGWPPLQTAGSGQMFCPDHLPRPQALPLPSGRNFPGWRQGGVQILQTPCQLPAHTWGVAELSRPLQDPPSLLASHSTPMPLPARELEPPNTPSLTRLRGGTDTLPAVSGATWEATWEAGPNR